MTDPNIGRHPRPGNIIRDSCTRRCLRVRKPPQNGGGLSFDPKKFHKGTACVLGLGRSGLRAANLLTRKGFKVLVSDSRPHKEMRPLAKKLHSKVKWEAGGHSDRVLSCRFVVKSPGIPSRVPILQKLRQAGIPIFSELEIALAFCRSREIVAVTGTNGKTTTTLLTAAVFQAARRRVLMAGNLGIPVSTIAPKAKTKDVLVLETSSYQLEDSGYFHPTAAAILNITADHVDHHGDMDRYIAAKARIFRHQSRKDVCVFNGTDPITVKLSRQSPCRRLFFSLERSTLSHAWYDGKKICIKLPGQKREVKILPPKLPGLHNVENAMAAALLGLDRGVTPRAIERAFKAFRGVEHRIEDCGVVRGIRCINDSKATNVESTLTALKALAGGKPHILLILGGLHKGYPYSPLRSYLGTPVKGILTIGSASGKIEEDLSGHVPIFPCGTLASAVDTACKIASPGDMLLLSPACASFDQFQDFEDRGRQFKMMVGKMAKKLSK